MSKTEEAVFNISGQQKHFCEDVYLVKVFWIGLVLSRTFAFSFSLHRLISPPHNFYG
jgi:hypothetical protein